MRQSFYLLFFFLIGQELVAQELLQSRQSSYYTYLYRLSEQQTTQVYRKGLSIIDETYFSDLADQYPTDSSYQGNLPYGNYLRTWTEGEKLMAELMSVSNVDLKVLNNGSDLQLQLFDSAGVVIREVEMWLRNKRIPFDDEQQVFRLKKSSRRGLLRVQHQGQLSFFYLERSIDRGSLVRVTRKVLYSVPLKYVWVPLKLIIRSPLDIYYSVRRRYPQGLFYYLYRPFQSIYRSISYEEPEGWVQRVGCLWNKEHCSFRFNQYQGYMVLNQPKYRPGDTVRCKAYVVDHRQRPVRDPLKFHLYDWRSEKNKLDVELQPYRPGAFTFEFVLHDSLKLTLDQNYQVTLVYDDYHSSLVTQSFRLEDYELSNTVYEIRAEASEHRPGEPAELKLKGTDTNGLNLLDARADLAVLTSEVYNISRETCFVPDTLWTHSLALEPAGSTSLQISDTLFPAVDLRYEAEATFYTPERDQEMKGVSLTYWQNPEELVLTLEDSLLHIEKLRAGESLKAEAKVIAFDGQKNELFTHTIQLPVQLPISPRVAEYEVTSDDLHQRLSVSGLPPQVQLFTSRTADSLTIQLENPRNLPVHYTIYRKNRVIGRGRGATLQYSTKTTTSANYFVALQYIWADEVVEENYEIPFKKNKLNVQVYEPSVVYPGQKPEIKVRVTDVQQRPVPDVDITAYGLTKKFEGYQPPTLPYLGKQYPDRTLINTFDKRDNVLDDEQIARQLDWQRWNARMHLDSIAYYRFLYPESGMYVSYFATPDSSTQVSPYVVKDGNLLPVHIIYLDNRPVYFSMVNHWNPYAFQADSGYHQLRIRTTYYELTVDSVFLQRGVKSLISFRTEQLPKGAKLVAMPIKLTDQERGIVNRYLYEVKNVSQQHTAYITQGQRAYWMEAETLPWQSQPGVFVTGPLAANRQTRFTLTDGFSMDFDPEPGYQHEFHPRKLKLRSNYDVIDGNRSLSGYTPDQPLSDLALTEAGVKEIIELRRANRQVYEEFYLNPEKTTAGRGKIGLLFPDRAKPTQFPKNVVLLRDDQPDFTRVYPGRTRTFHDLPPGPYRLYALLRDNSYWERPGIQVQANGTTYLKTINETPVPADSVSDYINEIIKQSFRETTFSMHQRQQDLQKIGNAYHSSRRKSVVSGEEVYGWVMDEVTMEPLPGVNVLAKGTQVGTVTDIDGHYQFKVPWNARFLVFSSIGFMTEEVALGGSERVDVTLAPDVQQLSEVVVVGYGVQSKSNLTGSVSIVSTIAAAELEQVLEGKVAGVKVQDGAIRIRGAVSVSNKNPIYVIDGQVYQGQDFDLDPSNMSRIEILDAEAATALYGAQGSQGAIVVTTRTNEQGVQNSLLNSPLSASGQVNPLRSNFSDYAFWEPKLRTNEQGVATFSPQFPDDVTGWRTFFLAMGSRQQSGQTEGVINAYKPVMGTLAVPRFLVEGDTTQLIGKALNYTSDTLNLTSSWEVEGQRIRTDSFKVRHASMDTLKVVANQSDSITVTYQIKNDKGFADGEQRAIPVYPQGILATEGGFHVLESDTTLQLTFDPLLGPVTVHAEADLWQVMLDEIEHVRTYAYLCNEQVASKLKVLVLKKRVMEMLDRPFEDEKQITRLIKRLKDSQRNDGLWGWWPKSPVSIWISQHVLEALADAEQAGFTVALDQSQVRDELVFLLESENKPDQLLRALRLLLQMGEAVDTKRYVTQLQQDTTLSLYQQLSLIKLQQEAGIRMYSLEEIMPHRQETLMGGMYWEDTTQHVYQNQLLTTLLAYQVLEREEVYQEYLPAIRRYLIDQRTAGHYRNTYESAQVLSALLPGLLKASTRIQPAKLVLENDNKQEEINEFPHTTQVSPNKPLIVRSSGNNPIYLTAYQQYHDPQPEPVSGDFTIDTYTDKPDYRWSVGEEIDIRVKLEVKKSADYVMIEIPIPSGCSYVKDAQYRPHEVHREYFREKVSIFSHHLDPGNYEFTITLLPKFTGTYHLNPAKAELMYFPTFYGRNEGKQVVLQEK